MNNPSDAQRPQPRRSSSRRRKGARLGSASPQDARARRKESQARAAAKAAAREAQAAKSAARAPKAESTNTSDQRFIDGRHGEKQGTANTANSRNQRGAAAKPTAQAAANGPRGALAARWALWKPHVKRFGVPLLINHGVTLGIILAFAVVVGIGAGFSRVPATIGSLWMALNLGSLNMTGAELGFLPLAPTIIFVWALARRGTTILGKSVSVRGIRIFIALSLLIPMLITCIAWLMLWDASKVFDLAAPNLAEALISTALVNGAAVVIGLRARIWRALLLRRDLPTWPVESFRLAASFLVWMMVAGGVVAVIYALTNMSAVVDSYDITNNLMGAIGLSLLALLYVPNIAIGSMAVLLGGEFHVGDGAVSLFTATNVNLPPVPILAAVPNEPIPGGPFFLGLTAIVAVAVVYRFVRTRGFIEAPIATAGGAGAAVAFMGFCVAWLAGGALGVYGSAGALEWLFAAESAAWLMVPALVFMVFAARAGAVVVEDVDDSLSTPTPSSPEEAATDQAEAASGKKEEQPTENQDAIDKVEEAQGVARKVSKPDEAEEPEVEVSEETEEK